MSAGFFDIIFECNSNEECKDCKYNNKDCIKFTHYFDFCIPSVVWRKVTSFDDLLKYVNDWREFNEQTNK